MAGAANALRSRLPSQLRQNTAYPSGYGLGWGRRVARYLKCLLAALAVVSISSAVQAAEPWRATNTTDALTDRVVREACAVEDEFRLCFSFNDQGVWVTVVALGAATFDPQLFPAFRVDQNQ